MTDQTREDFEAHFKPTIRQQKRHMNGDYRDPDIQAKWLGWQAKPNMLPPLDDEMREILGRPNFSCIQLANSLRTLGYEIPRKAEEEQAAVIYWMLSLYMQHGKAWKEKAAEILSGK